MNLTIAQPNQPAVVARFDWNMDILRDFDRNGLIDYGSSYGHPNPPSGYLVKLDACSSSRPIDPTTLNSPVPPRPMAINSTWRIEGNGVSFTQTSTGCFTTVNLHEGSYFITLTIALTPNCFSFCGETDTTSKRISVNNLLIVSIGDSISAGEGNPDKAQKFDVFGQVEREAIWEDRQCHRSAGAYPAQAALEIERSDPHSSVTFLHFACSGATIERGLIRSYEGQEPQQGQMIPAQTWQVAQAICGSIDDPSDPICLEPGRNIDILTISVGGNDIGFADIIKLCAKTGPGPAGFGCDNPAHDAMVTNALSRLPDLYSRLAEDISRRFLVSNVLIAEYLDPTHDERGNYCTTFGGRLSGITGIEARWAYERVITRLNQAIQNAAATHGWTYVEGSASQSSTHGVCAGDQRWFRTMEDSHTIQGPYCCPVDSTGTMHPNISGQSAIKNLHIPWIRELTSVSQPVALSLRDGNIEVFARATDYYLYHLWTAPHPYEWGNNGRWASLGQQLKIVGNPVAVNWAGNGIQVFARGNDNMLYHMWGENGQWNEGGWQSLGEELSIVGDPVAVTFPDGNIEVFARGTDNFLYHMWTTGSGQWNEGGWQSLGQQLSFGGGPVSVSWARNGIQVFARGTDNRLYHMWGENGQWNEGGWQSLGEQIPG